LKKQQLTEYKKLSSRHARIHRKAQAYLIDNLPLRGKAELRLSTGTALDGDGCSQGPVHDLTGSVTERINRSMCRVPASAHRFVKDVQLTPNCEDVKKIGL